MEAPWQHTFALAFLQFPQALSVTDAGAFRFLPGGCALPALPLSLAFSVRGRVCLSNDGSVLEGSVGPVCCTSSIEWTECSEEASVVSASMPTMDDGCQGKSFDHDLSTISRVAHCSSVLSRLQSAVALTLYVSPRMHEIISFGPYSLPQHHASRSLLR